jgi:polyisoprenoid-binding protein YceI
MNAKHADTGLVSHPRNFIVTSMKDLKTITIASALLVLAAAGCSDPSSDVHRTSGAEPQQVAGSPSTAGTEYVIRSGSKVGFTGSKVTGSHDGGFNNFAGSIRVADGKIVGNPEIRIAMKSLWADNEKLTGHLKSADFFEVEKYPVTTFTVTGVQDTGAQQTVTGNLEMHGVTKSISFPAKIQVTDDAVTVAAEFAINRRDFNINYPGSPNDLIRDNVVIKLDLRATPGPALPEDQLAQQ